MTAILAEIDRARTDLEEALGDLGAATRELTPTHWKTQAAQAFRRQPVRILAVAALAGFWLGMRR